MYIAAIRNALGLTKPPKPTLFDTHQAFQAALRGHSQANSCFAWGRYELTAGRATCIILAEAYASEDCSGPALFALKETLFHLVEWPLSMQNSERLEIIINDINTTFHRTAAY